MEQGYIKVTIDGTELLANEGQSIVDAAREHGIDIPTLCDYKSLPPAGTCRICTVKVSGKFVPGCTTPVTYGMTVDSESPELVELRRGLLEMLFVEGNHMCPSCEKSGSCELQHLAYRYKVLAPRFPFLFPHRKIDAELPHLLIEHNRCIQCLRCVRGVKAKDGHDLFGFAGRGNDIHITVDTSDPDALTEQTAQRAMDICPVGALIKKRTAFTVPIGKRRFDQGDAQ
ncbi:MAG TPA: 2Fe-2S iron-sulfur cluster-binding protein [Pseudomonadota bacterium]|nr:2Fe-2S iron-sulfur cluster-binding protein [Pseudomonadota bacterium]